MKWLNDLKTRLHPHFPSLPKSLGFKFIVRIEIAIVCLAALSLYLFRIHPYLVLTSTTIIDQRKLNQEISETLFKRYSEQVREVNTWWNEHVKSADELPKLLQTLNPVSGSDLVGSIQVGEVLSKGDYRTVSIEATFQGDYASLLEWMHYLETLPFFIQVEAMDIRPHPSEDINKPNLASPPLMGTVKLQVVLKKN